MDTSLIATFKNGTTKQYSSLEEASKDTGLSISSIKIRANNMDILIDGKDLDIKEITDFELVVEGDIYSINYQK